MQIVDYRIISAESPDELQSKVQAFIQDGWQPTGQCQIQQSARLPGRGPMQGQALYIQTIVRYSD